MLTVCFGPPLAGHCQWYQDNGTVTSRPDICLSAFRFLATLEFRVRDMLHISSPECSAEV